MDIKTIVKQNIQDIETQLSINLSEKYLKPIVFIDNTNFGSDENPLAIVHLDIFDSKDVVSLRENLNAEDAFIITNLVGEETVYCTWGESNVVMIKERLEEWGYLMSSKTVFFDLKKEASDFYNRKIESFEDVQNIISFADGDMDLIFSSKESVMYSLFIDMLNNGYKNDVLESTIEHLILQNELANADNIFKGREFRTAKSSIGLEENELVNLQKFVDSMMECNALMGEYLDARVKSSDLNSVHRMLLDEKATMCRFKKSAYVYTKALLKAYENEDFETYTFYYKTLDMYALIEDAYILSEVIKDETNSFSRFVADLGSTFTMSTASHAQAYLLRKNVIAKLNK